MEDKKDVTKIILEEIKLSKEELKRKNNEIINELTSYKNNLLKDDEDSVKNSYGNEDNFTNKSENSLFEYDNEYGYMFDLNNIDNEELEIVNDVLLKDPIFALKFLERKKDFIPRDEYEMLKSKIIDKMDFK